MQELEFSDSIQIEISCPLLIVSELESLKYFNFKEHTKTKE